MTVIACCGHGIVNFPDGNFVFWMKEFSEGKNAISLMSSCKECYDFYEKEGDVLHDQKEVNLWLNNDENIQTISISDSLDVPGFEEE